MRILLVDGDQSEGVVLAGQLGERGHEVVRCFPPEGHTLCIGASDSSKCPVESLGCDVALIVCDAETEPGLREMGAGGLIFENVNRNPAHHRHQNEQEQGEDDQRAVFVLGKIPHAVGHGGSH